MGLQTAKFFLCSFGIHLMALGGVYQAVGMKPRVELAAKNNLVAEHAPIVVSIIEEKKSLPQLSDPPEKQKSLVKEERPREELVAQTAVPPAEKADVSSGRKEPPQEKNKANVIGEPPEAVANAVAVQQYLPADQVTHRPFPLSSIDLNVTAIHDIAIAGKVELTILVDADGVVADVIKPVDVDENTRIFADHIAGHFKNTRFKPAEMNGQPVKAQLKIVVVSEKSTLDERAPAK